jgi:hypothetical protein
MTTRADIAAALNTAAIPFGRGKVVASEYRPGTLAPGQAWAQYVLDRDQRSGQFAASWTVWLILPADEKGSSVWLDQSWPLLVEALRPVMYVQRFEPAVIGADGMFGVLITGESE